jgi:murein DD-endopeptidase MepM/ murein hydrolase activator NlpD
VGQKVERGQLIGEVGSTGHSTGPHVHFEIRVDGKRVDPSGYVPPTPPH